MSLFTIELTTAFLLPLISNIGWSKVVEVTMTSEAVAKVGLVLVDCNMVKSADFKGVILESEVKESIRVKLGSEATDSEVHDVTLNKSLNSKSVDTWREATACAASAEAASSISGLEAVRKVVVESGRVGFSATLTEVSILRSRLRS